jgi:hypothetical protein
MVTSASKYSRQVGSCPTCPTCEPQVGQQKRPSLLHLSHLSQLSHLIRIKEKKRKIGRGERSAAAAQGINWRSPNLLRQVRQVQQWRAFVVRQEGGHAVRQVRLPAVSYHHQRS